MSPAALLLAQDDPAASSATSSTTSSPATPSSAAAATDTAAANADVAAIRNSATDFVDAFKLHDARAIAQLWTENGQYVDEAGQEYQGRMAIEQAYAQFFQEHPDAELQVTIDSIRLMNPTTAIEDGTAQLTPRSAAAPGGSRYVAIHVKQDDGTWLLASVRDSHADVPPTYGHLQHLDVLVGEWTAEHAGTTAEVTCHWNTHKSFLERRFVVTRDGQVVSSSTEIIGWDPVTGQITSWAFMSDGGRAQGTWTALEDAWVVQNEGITADGVRTSAVDVWAPLLDGALGWQSTRRSVGETPVGDARHVVLKKQPAADKPEE